LLIVFSPSDYHVRSFGHIIINLCAQDALRGSQSYIREDDSEIESSDEDNDDDTDETYYPSPDLGSNSSSAAIETTFRTVSAEDLTHCTSHVDYNDLNDQAVYVGSIGSILKKVGVTQNFVILCES
jgi:hypothetical protein